MLPHESDALIAEKLLGYVKTKKQGWLDTGAKINDPKRPVLRATFRPTSNREDNAVALAELVRVGLREARSRGVPLAALVEYAVLTDRMHDLQTNISGLLSAIVTLPTHHCVLYEDPNP